QRRARPRSAQPGAVPDAPAPRRGVDRPRVDRPRALRRPRPGGSGLPSRLPRAGVKVNAVNSQRLNSQNPKSTFYADRPRLPELMISSCLWPLGGLGVASWALVGSWELRSWELAGS